MKKLQEAAKWMWNCRSRDIWLNPSVLTSQNNDPTVPTLTVVEAESVFRLLEEKKLIFPIRNQYGTIAYLINEVKEKEWNEFLKEVNPFHRFVLQPLLKIFKNIWTVFIWLISIIIASWMGAFFSAWMQSVFKTK